MNPCIQWPEIVCKEINVPLPVALGAVSSTIERLSCFLHPRGSMCVCVCVGNEGKSERERETAGSSLCASILHHQLTEDIKTKGRG